MWISLRKLYGLYEFEVVGTILKAVNRQSEMRAEKSFSNAF